MKRAKLIFSGLAAVMQLPVRARRQAVLGFAALAWVLCSPVNAQFGGRPDDVVFYAVTYGGSGEFQTLPPGTTNTAAQNSNVKLTHLADVPFVGTAPFPLERKVLYSTPTETFQYALDTENTVGLHRLNLSNVKIFQVDGALNLAFNIVGFGNSFIQLPQGLDVGGDLTLLDLKILMWIPGPLPFIQVTDRQGPYPCPPGYSGFACVLTIPNGIVLPSLIPWFGLKNVYPSGRWQEGIDQKILTQEPSGVTIRQIRLRPGRQTPLIRTAGHTHLYVLQGGAVVTPAGGSSMTMIKDDYTLMGENITFSVSNPKRYQGPVTR